jgi:methylglutaconyl-CoA hydratase
MSDTIVAAIDERGIATIAFNRPDKSNAFDPGMRRNFVARLAGFHDDPKVRAVFLRGNGKHFCAGSDVASFGSETPEQRVEMFLRLDAFPKPTVALVQGACLGAALAMVACCDIVIAAPDAFFSIPEVRLGIAPLGLTPLFLRAIGPSAFRRYGLSGEKFDGAEALRLGLAHQLCTVGKFDAEAGALADNLLRAAPVATALVKRTARDLSQRQDLAAEIVHLAHEERRQMQGAEAQEGIASFREKRTPAWYKKP